MVFPSARILLASRLVELWSGSGCVVAVMLSGRGCGMVRVLRLR